MIIQENHAAGRAIFIIAYGGKTCLFYTDEHIEEIENAIHGANHVAG